MALIFSFLGGFSTSLGTTSFFWSFGSFSGNFSGFALESFLSFVSFSCFGDFARSGFYFSCFGFSADFLSTGFTSSRYFLLYLILLSSWCCLDAVALLGAFSDLFFSLAYFSLRSGGFAKDTFFAFDSSFLGASFSLFERSVCFLYDTFETLDPDAFAEWLLLWSLSDCLFPLIYILPAFGSCFGSWSLCVDDFT